MILDATTKSLEVLLGEVITTSQLDIVAGYLDYAPSGQASAGEQDGVTNSTTAVTAVSAPATDVQRIVNEIRVTNTDSVTHQVILRLNNNGTFRIMQEQEVQPGATFTYGPGIAPSPDTPSSAILMESGPSTKISALPAATLPLDGTELTVLVQSSADVRSTTQDILNIGTINGTGTVSITSKNEGNPADLLMVTGTISSSGTDPTGQVFLSSGDNDGTGDTGALTIGTGFQSGGAGGTPSSGALLIRTGDSALGNAGNMTVRTGTPAPGAGGGTFSMGSGNAAAGATSGAVTITTGDAVVGGGSGGFNLGSGANGDTSGGVTIFTGQVDAGSTFGSGELRVQTGNAAAGVTGSMLIFTGDGDKTGGIHIQPGFGSTKSGNLFFENIATSDPGETDAVFYGDGTFVLRSSGNTVQEQSIASGSAVGLTTGTPADVASITLTAGKWLVQGVVHFTGAGGTTVTRVAGSLSTTTATMGTAPGSFVNQYLAGATMTNIGQDISSGGAVQVDLTGSQTWFLVARAVFATSTLAAYGEIVAIPII